MWRSGNDDIWSDVSDGATGRSGRASGRRQLFDSVDLIAEFAEGMSELLLTGDITATRAFLRHVCEADHGPGRSGNDQLDDSDAAGQPDRALRLG